MDSFIYELPAVAVNLFLETYYVFIVLKNGFIRVNSCTKCYSYSETNIYMAIYNGFLVMYLRLSFFGFVTCLSLCGTKHIFISFFFLYYIDYLLIQRDCCSCLFNNNNFSYRQNFVYRQGVNAVLNDYPQKVELCVQLACMYVLMQIQPDGLKRLIKKFF